MIVAGLICVLIVIVAVISSVWPMQEDYFFELGLLGKNKTADNYFVDIHSTVDLGIPNSWFFYVHNHMGTTQEVSIRAKLLNYTMELPDDQKHQPSPVPSFADFPLSISNNETVLIPFSWSIMEIKIENNSTVIKRLIVNEVPVEVSVSDSLNSSFRITVELWVKDPDSGIFIFGWESKEGFSSASNFMEFILNSTEVGKNSS